MTLDDIITKAYLPALDIIGVKDSDEARVMMLAVGLQESRFEHRRQMNNGPAMGFWQFERGGGVRGVLRHATSKAKAAKLCQARNTMDMEMQAWQGLQYDDVLAAGFARLLLLTDPRALPEINEREDAYLYYIRNWRPGRPHPESWPKNYAKAIDAVCRPGSEEGQAG